MKTLDAYAGATENSQTPLKDVYNSILKELIQTCVKDEITLFTSISSRYERSLFEMRNNDLSKAKEHLSEAEGMQKEFADNELMYRLLDLWHLPIKAYFFYKLSKFSKAENLLILSIDEAALLVRQGFFIVEFHKIQQLHNIARLYYKQKKIDCAGRIINEAVNYIITGNSPSIGKEWSFPDLEQSPISLKSSMILQMVLESAGELLPPTMQDPRFYKAIFENLPKIQPSLSNGTFLDEWISLRELYLMEVDHSSFIELATDFIINKPSKSDILKLSLMVCIWDLLKKTESWDETSGKYLLRYSQKLKVSNRQKEAFRVYLGI